MDEFIVERAELESIHNLRLAEISVFRDILGYPPLVVAFRVRELPAPPSSSDRTVALTLAQVKRLHDLRLAELAIMRDVLGFPPIVTGKQARRQEEVKPC